MLCLQEPEIMSKVEVDLGRASSVMAGDQDHAGFGLLNQCQKACSSLVSQAGYGTRFVRRVATSFKDLAHSFGGPLPPTSVPVWRAEKNIGFLP